MTMNPRKERFAIEYAVSGNATHSAIEAGYSEQTAYSQGSRLLKTVEVRDAVEAEKERAIAPVRASLAWIVESAAEIASDTENPAAARVSALALLAKRFPEFRDGAIVDARTVNFGDMDATDIERVLLALSSPQAGQQNDH